MYDQASNIQNDSLNNLDIDNQFFRTDATMISLPNETSRIEDDNNEIFELTESLNASNLRLEAALMNNQILHDSKLSLETEYASKIEYVTWLEKECSNFETTKIEMDTNISNLEMQLHATIERLYSTESSLVEKCNKVSSLENANENLKLELVSLREMNDEHIKLSDENRRLLKLISDLQFQLKSTQNEIKSYSQQAEYLEQEYEEKKTKQMIQLKDELNSLNAQKSSKEMLIDKIKNDLNIATLERASLQDKVAKLTVELNYKEKIQEELIVTNKELQQWVERYDQEVNNKKYELEDEYKSEITHLKSEIESAYLYTEEIHDKMVQERDDMVHKLNQEVNELKEYIQLIEERNVCLQNEYSQKILEDSKLMEEHSNVIELLTTRRNTRNESTQMYAPDPNTEIEVIEKYVKNTCSEQVVCNLVLRLLRSSIDSTSRSPVLYLNDVVNMLCKNLLVLKGDYNSSKDDILLQDKAGYEDMEDSASKSDSSGDGERDSDSIGAMTVTMTSQQLLCRLMDFLDEDQLQELVGYLTTQPCTKDKILRPIIKPSPATSPPRTASYRYQSNANANANGTGRANHLPVQVTRAFSPSILKNVSAKESSGVTGHKKSVRLCVSDQENGVIENTERDDEKMFVEEELVDEGVEERKCYFIDTHDGREPQQWIEFEDAVSGKKYYHNPVTEETVWHLAIDLENLEDFEEKIPSPPHESVKSPYGTPNNTAQDVKLLGRSAVSSGYGQERLFASAGIDVSTISTASTASAALAKSNKYPPIETGNNSNKGYRYTASNGNGIPSDTREWAEYRDTNHLEQESLVPSIGPTTTIHANTNVAQHGYDNKDMIRPSSHNSNYSARNNETNSRIMSSARANGGASHSKSKYGFNVVQDYREEFNVDDLKYPMEINGNIDEEDDTRHLGYAASDAYAYASQRSHKDFFPLEYHNVSDSEDSDTSTPPPLPPTSPHRLDVDSISASRYRSRNYPSESHPQDSHSNHNHGHSSHINHLQQAEARYAMPMSARTVQSYTHKARDGIDEDGMSIQSIQSMHSLKSASFSENGTAVKCAIDWSDRRERYSIRNVFLSFCANPESEEMDSAHFIKFCRETDISYTEDNRGGMKNTILDIIFEKAKKRGKKRITFEDYRDIVVPAIAAKFKCEPQSVISKMSKVQGPKYMSDVSNQRLDSYDYADNNTGEVASRGRRKSTFAGEANKPGGIFDRLSQKSSFTGVKYPVIL